MSKFTNKYEKYLYKYNLGIRDYNVVSKLLLLVLQNPEYDIQKIINVDSNDFDKLYIKFAQHLLEKWKNYEYSWHKLDYFLDPSIFDWDDIAKLEQFTSGSNDLSFEQIKDIINTSYLTEEQQLRLWTFLKYEHKERKKYTYNKWVEKENKSLNILGLEIPFDIKQEYIPLLFKIEEELRGYYVDIKMKDGIYSIEDFEQELSEITNRIDDIMISIYSKNLITNYNSIISLCDYLYRQLNDLKYSQ
jgi:hypothetical protein